MNKQQLAQKIWASANQMRSKIEANEYKDYILGFIFYKYLSDKEIKFLKENDYDDELLKTVSEEDDETVKWVQENIGYFIAYKDLFSTWLSMGKDFDVSNVRDALSAFSRLISNTHKKRTTDTSQIATEIKTLFIRNHIYLHTDSEHDVQVLRERFLEWKNRSVCELNGKY